MKKEDLDAINEIVMKRSELVDELNNALFDDNDGKRDMYYIQTTLNWEQWKELAPYMDFGDYEFERLFDEDLTDEDWENDEEVQDLAWQMAECANYIKAVLIEPFGNSANVILANGIIKRGGDFFDRFFVVNV